MSDPLPTSPPQQNVPHLLLGGFQTDPVYDYDVMDAQYCLTMAHELGHLAAYFQALVAEAPELPAGTDPNSDLIQLMSTPYWFSRWMVNCRIPELKVQLDSTIIGSDSHTLADVALDNAKYLGEQLFKRGLIKPVEQDEADEQTYKTLLGE